MEFFSKRSQYQVFSHVLLVLERAIFPPWTGWMHVHTTLTLQRHETTLTVALLACCIMQLVQKFTRACTETVSTTTCGESLQGFTA
jgi:hypothetical protein